MKQTSENKVPNEPDSDRAINDNVDDCDCEPTPEADDVDSIEQAKYRQEYLRQLRQRSCPGCGETDLF